MTLKRKKARKEKRNGEIQDLQRIINNIVILSISLSTITFNINVLNSLIKGYRMDE